MFYVRTPAPASAASHAVKTSMEEKKLLNKVIILVFFTHKIFSLLHKIKVEPLMSHELFELCPYYLSEDTVCK